MGISSNSWFASVYETWLGTSMSQSTWESFLSDNDVQQLAANNTSDYQRLYLQKFIASTFGQDAIVKGLTQEAYPGATDDQTKTLIQSFFEQPQVLALPATATKQDYYTLYWAYLFETALLNDPTVSAWFQSTAEQFCGSVTQSQLQQIIAAFLATSSVQSLPSSATLEDYQRLFIQYLSSALNQTHIAEQVTGQSPEAVQQYKILWSVFGLLAQMLSTMTISQIRNAVAVQFLQQKRSVGAGGYDKAPTYVGDGTIDSSVLSTLKTLFSHTSNDKKFYPSSLDSVFTKINVDIDDPSKFTLGYSNVSVQDITNWLYSQASSSPSGESSFNLYSGDYVIGDGHDTFDYASQVLTLGVQNIDGSPVITASLVQYDDGNVKNFNSDGTVNWEKELAAGRVTTTTQIPSITKNLVTNDQTTVKDALNQAFTTLWENGTNAGYIEPTATNNHLTPFETVVIGQHSHMQEYFLAARTPKIAWSMGILANSYSGSGDNLYLNSILRQSRSIENQNVSAQITALTARMDVLKSLTDQQTQIETASSSENKMSCDAMRALIVTMQQILSSFFA